MSSIQQVRMYHLHGLDFRITCSSAIAECLESRFRLLPVGGDHRLTIPLDFQCVSDAGQHCVKRPEEKSRIFYELSSGEACYFAAHDQVYLRFRDGVQALSKPGLRGATFSVIESNPDNVFMACHLMLTILFVEIMKRHGFYSLHAAGFCKDGRAILIPGSSGAGKSTLAITLLRGGFGYLSDDMVYLQKSSDTLEVFGLPEDVDVSDQTIGFFPELNFLRSSPKAVAWAKRPVRPDAVYGTQIIRAARPGAIVFPKISVKEVSVVRPINAKEALLEIVTNVLLTETLSCQAHLDVLSQLVNQTPCYRLETGRDFDRLPQLLRELLSGSREQVEA